MGINHVALGSLVALAVLMTDAGCERRRPAATRPATRPAVVATTSPATAAAAMEPTVSHIWIDQTPYEFPPAVLVLRGRDDQLVATLFSNDPPEAVRDDYAGNSYYFETTPILAEAGTLAGASWQYKAPSSEREDQVQGIFLNGRQLHLQPFDVRIDFLGTSSPMPVRLAGTFLMFDTQDDRQPGRLVPVHAELTARVTVKGRPETRPTAADRTNVDEALQAPPTNLDERR